MILKSIYLQNFRNYTKSEFTLNPKTTIVIGPNAIGKSNFIEAIYMLSAGKSSRSDDRSCIQFGKQITRVHGRASNDGDNIDLEVVLSTLTKTLQRKYLVNKVSKRRTDFASHIPVVHFSPVDLDIVAGQPGVRRKFLDDALEAVDSEYRASTMTYTKALKQRNALLRDVQETGSRDTRRFEYWDGLLIKNGQKISKKRQELISYINDRKKELLDFVLEYDKSEISAARIEKYKNAEIGAGVTLVGPHRDELIIRAKNDMSKNFEEVRLFGSRGQQRLVALELKLSQISLIKEKTKKEPILLLDDIFSELDNKNINLILSLMDKYQTVLTTTHKEFVGRSDLEKSSVIELGK